MSPARPAAMPARKRSRGLVISTHGRRCSDLATVLRCNRVRSRLGPVPRLAPALRSAARHAEGVGSALRSRALPDTAPHAMTARPSSAMCAPMLHINDLTFRIEGRIIFDKATVGHSGRAQGRLRRPQRLGQDHAAAPDRRRAAARRRRHQPAPRHPHRLGGAGGAGRARQPDRVRAGRRQGARAPAGRGRDRARSRPHRRHPRAARPTSARMPPRRAPRASWPASASTRRPSSAPARSSPAAGACAWRSPPCCSPSPTCCCSTSPPTTSTSKARCGWRSTCADYPHTVLIVSHDRELLNRSVGVDPASGAGQAHPLHRRLRPVRGGAAREAAPRPQAQEEAGRRAPPHRGVHRSASRPRPPRPRRRRAASRRWRACSRSPSRSRSGWCRSCSPTRPRRSRSPLIRLEGAAVGYAAGQAGAAGSRSAPRCRRPHRPARRQRQRQEHLRQADLRAAWRRWHGRRYALRQDRPSAISPSIRWTTCRPARRPTSTCST